MRAFLAIDFDSGLKAQIAGLQSRLRRYEITGRWKHIDNFHLTLKFLDEINEDNVKDIDGVMGDICAGRSGFGLYVAKLGCFPGRDAIRVLWLGLGGDLEKLGSLQGETDKGLSALGFETEKRPYRPHVTIAQDISFSRDFDGLTEMFDYKQFSPIRADRVYLFKSEQAGGKRLYTRISEYVFRR